MKIVIDALFNYDQFTTTVAICVEHESVEAVKKIISDYSKEYISKSYEAQRQMPPLKIGKEILPIHSFIVYNGASSSYDAVKNLAVYSLEEWANRRINMDCQEEAGFFMMDID